MTASFEKADTLEEGAEVMAVPVALVNVGPLVAVVKESGAVSTGEVTAEVSNSSPVGAALCILSVTVVSSSRLDEAGTVLKPM